MSQSRRFHIAAIKAQYQLAGEFRRRQLVAEAMQI
jgi:hypothetical protein